MWTSALSLFNFFRFLHFLFESNRIFGLFENVAQGSMNVTAVATKNVTVLGIDALELYQILENIESGLVDHTQNQKQKFTDDLYASNKVKMELEQDAQKYVGANMESAAWTFFSFND